MNAVLIASALALSHGARAGLPAAPPRVLTICDDVQDPATLDPQKQFSEKNHTLVQQIYEGLVRFGPDGTIEPGLAVEWRRLDPLTFQFRLRKGVRFHDGEPFDAEAVRFSIERYLRPETGFPALGFISSLSRVDVLDSHTVNVVTRVPDGLILNRLAGFIVVVPPAYVRRNGEHALSERPVGTGPFRFERWEKGRQIVLSANRHYWDPALPKVDRLVFRFLPEVEQVAGLLAGDVDIVTELPGRSTFRVQSSTAARVVKSRSLYTVTASLNVSSGPLRDARVRRALNHGIDKRELVRYELFGNGEPIGSLIFPRHPARFHDDTLKPYEYSPAAARRLLAEAGAVPGLRLRILEVKATRAARIITAQWRRLGIESDVVSTTDARMRDDLRSGHWDVFLSGCPDPMYHPYFIHSIFLHSLSPYSLGRDAKVDDLIESLAREIDETEQVRRTKELARHASREALALFTYQRVKTYGVRRGVVFEPYASGMPHYRTAEVRPP